MLKKGGTPNEICNICLGVGVQCYCDICGKPMCLKCSFKIGVDKHACLEHLSKLEHDLKTQQEDSFPVCKELRENFTREDIKKFVNQKFEALDGEQIRKFNTGSVRDISEGKGRCDLLPACSILRLAKHYETGANKYGPRNWEKGQPISALMDSGLRHLLNYLDGRTDEDHLAAVAWNILGAMWMEEKKPEMQDIPSRIKKDIKEFEIKDGNGNIVMIAKEDNDE